MSGNITIALDGSTYRGSVALIRDKVVIVERTLGEPTGHMSGAGRGDKLMPAIAECMREANVVGSDIARIVCGAGPGSFTSLRVAGSVAKGLAVGYGVELYSISSLLLTVAAVNDLPPGPYISLLGAMRDEFFALRVLVDEDGGVRQIGRSGIMSQRDLDYVLSRESAVRLIGPGQPIDVGPSARGVPTLLDKILKAGPVSIDTWEPDYGRLAEAQVKWEAEHGRPLTT